VDFLWHAEAHSCTDIILSLLFFWHKKHFNLKMRSLPGTLYLLLLPTPRIAQAQKANNNTLKFSLFKFVHWTAILRW